MKNRPYKKKRELYSDLGKLLKQIGKIEARIGTTGSFPGSDVYFGHVASAYSVIENSHGVLGDHIRGTDESLDPGPVDT